MNPFTTSMVRTSLPIIPLFSLFAGAAGCLTDEELETSEVELEATVYAWSEDAPIGTSLETWPRSDYQVGLATLNDRVAMVYTGKDYLLYSASYGRTPFADRGGLFAIEGWSSAVKLPFSTRAGSGPALVNHGGQLVLVYHPRFENRLMMATSPNGADWTAPVTAGSTLGGAGILEAPAAVSHRGTLYIGYCTRTSAGDRVRIDRLDGASWTKLAELPVTNYRCAHVALASLPDGKLDILANVENASTGTYSTFEWAGFGTPASTWLRYTLGMKSKKPISIATCGGITHLVHGGHSTPNEIWWTVREGGYWLYDTRIPDQVSDGGASLACFGTDTIMVHNGSYDFLWWARYSE